MQLAIVYLTCCLVAEERRDVITQAMVDEIEDIVEQTTQETIAEVAGEVYEKAKAKG